MTALRPGAEPKPTPRAKERKRLKATPHRIPDWVREAVLDRAGRVCEACHRPGGKLVNSYSLNLLRDKQPDPADTTWALIGEVDPDGSVTLLPLTFARFTEWSAVEAIAVLGGMEAV